MILWGFISSMITEGCIVFVASNHIIKQISIPMFMHVARLLWRNIIILGHNIVIFPLVLLFIWQPLTWVALLFIPGFILLVINLAWITLFLGILCARYRDLSPIINSMLQILFYLTPIMWMPDRLSQRAGRPHHPPGDRLAAQLAAGRATHAGAAAVRCSCRTP
jgi:lipopolysaccharide transport system permease protein